MQHILKTSIYNSFYTDFLSKKISPLRFLPSIDTKDVAQLTMDIDPDSMIHKKVKKILVNQNKDFSSAKAKKNLHDLLEPNSVIVITGQQLGLFMSPLYTIYKAITTVKLAEKLNSKYPWYKYIPVFWMETEDHDFKEVNHFGIWDKNNKPQKIVYSGLDLEKVSMRHYEIEQNIDELFSLLSEEMLLTEFSKELLSKLHKIYAKDKNWAEASRNYLKSIFEESGLLLFNPGDKEIKNISIEFFTQLLHNADEISESFAKRSKEIVTAGYNQQVPVIEGKTFIHIENDIMQREHLYKERNQYLLKKSSKSLSRGAVEVFIREHPEKVSTSVVSRPVLQSWLLPVIAYVAGPGEIAYWAQLGSVFEKMEVKMPVIYPRLNATLIEPKIARFIEKNKVDVENLQVNKQEFIDAYFKHSTGQKGEGVFDSTRQLFYDQKLKIKNFVKNIDPTLEMTVIKTFEKIENQFSGLETKSIRAMERKNQSLKNQLEQIHQAFFPEDKPQERFISIIYFINKFGTDVIKQIIEKLNLEIDEHQIISIE